MGGKKSKEAGGKPMKLPPKNKGLSKKDFDFLAKQTGLSQVEIKTLYDEFMANNPDGQLDKGEFVRLYIRLRSEPRDQVDQISQYVFRAFDGDNNGHISFSEFLVAYAMTSRGDPRNKLEYTFDVYDADNNGYLDREELRTVIYGMLDLLGADQRGHDAGQLAQETMRKLDSNRDGRINKHEFIDGLLSNYALRALISPFN